MSDAFPEIRANPFYVLGVPTSATRLEVERAGQKLLGMLELGLAGAERYATPLGEQRRDPELVRRAMAELREPARRLVAELWAVLPPEVVVPLSAEEAPAPGGVPGALAELGLGWRSA